MQRNLQKLTSQVRIGGKGTPRRKIKKHKNTQETDKKLVQVLKKLNVQQLQQVEQVNFFLKDGSVMHFAMPQVQASVASNTFVIQAQAQTMSLTEVIKENPSILAQLGAFPQLQDALKEPTKDDEVPELVSFE
jgi:nascent polypeptide-associated complex subunit beta